MWEAIQALDTAALQAVQGTLDPLHLVFSVLTILGHPVFWFGVAAILLWKGREKESFFLVNVVLLSNAVTGVLKWLVARPRPSPEQFATHWDPLTAERFEKGVNFSFPSGHSTLSTTVLAYYRRKFSKRQQVLGIIVIALVALSRLVIGKHFFSDVLAGILLGAILGTICWKIQESFRKHDFRLSKLKAEVLVVAVIVAALIAMFFSVSLGLLSLLLGYYAGFFLGKETELRYSMQSNIRIGLGLIVFVFFGFIGYPFVGGILQDVIFFLAGFWVSWLWPRLSNLA